jgi:hypothetical protein
MGTSLNNLYFENNSKEQQKRKKFFTVSTVISVATVCYANQASASARESWSDLLHWPSKIDTGTDIAKDVL